MNKFIKRLAILGAAGMGLAISLRSVQRRRGRIDFAGQSVVITGGSRGLGLVIARLLAEEGARLALIARDDEELARAEQDLQRRDAEVMTVACDVRDRHQVEQALAKVFRRYGKIDVLINNAGIIQVGPVEHMRLQDFEDAMEVHFWGPLYAILAVAPYMRQQREGRIVNISSIGGKVAVPHLAPYTVSKFALVGLSDAMRAELDKDGIRVTTVSPGLMRTGSYVNALFKGRTTQEYTWFSTFDALPVSSTAAESAAHQIIEACRYGDPELTITPQARAMVIANAVFPRLFADAMKVFDRLLPRPTAPLGSPTPRTGWESQSEASPSAATALGDEAIGKNNEIPGPAVG